MRPLYTTPTVGDAVRAESPPEFAALRSECAESSARGFGKPLTGNLLNSPVLAVREVRANAGPVLMWSGWHGPDALDGPFSPAANWSVAAWQALGAFVTAVAAELPPVDDRSGCRCCFMPQAGTVLSDLPSCQRFLNMLHEWAGAHALMFEILLDPIGLLTVDMLPRAAEHVERIVMGLGTMPGVAGLLVTNVATDSLARKQVHHGAIPVQLIRLLLSEHCRPDLPLCFLDIELEEQLAALGLVR